MVNDLDFNIDDLTLSVQNAFKSGELTALWKEYTFTRAKNAIDWVTNSDFLGYSTLYKRPKQYETLRDIYSLLCPYCNNPKTTRDCKDRTIEDLKKDILLQYGRCPVCKRYDYEMYQEGSLYPIDEALLIWGMRSGKSTLIGVFNSTYICHRYLAYPGSIMEYFGLLKATMLEAGFFAASKEQVRDTIWGYFFRAFKENPWFNQYIEKMQEYAKKNKIPFSDIFVLTPKQVVFLPNQIQFIPYHSKATTTAGRTRFLSVIDEMGKFETVNAEEIYGIPKASLQTLLPLRHKKLLEESDVLPVQMIEIGSRGKIPQRDPLYKRYMDLKKLKEQGLLQNTYLSWLATWEANPDISREDLDSEFITDPVGANRNFGCEALDGREAFYPEHYIDAAMQGTEPPKVFWGTISKIKNVGTEQRHFISAHITEATYFRDPVYIIADAGDKRDSFALCIASAIDKGTYILGLIQIEPKTILINGQQQVAEVEFSCVLDIIKLLKTRFNILFVEFDRWESILLTQEIQKLGIRTARRNVKRSDYLTAKLELMSERVFVPIRVPAHMQYAYNTLVIQAKSVYQRTDTKIANYTEHDDVVQVFTRAVSIGANPKEAIQEIFKSTKGLVGISGVRRGVAFRSKNGAVSQQNMGGGYLDLPGGLKKY